MLRVGSRLYMSRRTMACLLAWLPPTRDPAMVPMLDGFSIHVHEGELLPTPRMIRRQQWMRQKHTKRDCEHDWAPTGMETTCHKFNGPNVVSETHRKLLQCRRCGKQEWSHT